MVFDKAQPRLVLQDLLQPPEEVQDLFLCRKRFPVTWDDEALRVPVAAYGEVGNVVGHVGPAAQWGTRVYRHVLPATKASSFGVAGRTHLVAQRFNGEWRARTLSVQEVKAWCTSARVELVLPADPETAMSALGNSGPARMVLPFADGLSARALPGSDAARCARRRFAKGLPRRTHGFEAMGAGKAISSCLWGHRAGQLCVPARGTFVVRIP